MAKKINLILLIVLVAILKAEISFAIYGCPSIGTSTNLSGPSTSQSPLSGKHVVLDPVQGLLVTDSTIPAGTAYYNANPFYVRYYNSNTNQWTLAQATGVARITTNDVNTIGAGGWTSSNPTSCTTQPECPIRTDIPGFYWPLAVGDTFMLANPHCTVPECNQKEDVHEYTNGKHTCIRKDCPEGFVMDSAGNCTCDAESELVNGTCWPKCPNNQQRDKVTHVCNPGPVCKENEEIVNGTCVGKCISGLVRNSWGECTNPCIIGEHMDLTTNQCVNDCPDGQIKDKTTGQCVQNDCQPNQIKINGVCVDDNCIGGNIVGGKCIKNCKEGESEDANGNCQPNCPDGSTRDSTGKCLPIKCPTGQSLVNGLCTPNKYPSDPGENTKTPGTVDNGTKTDPGTEAGKKTGSGTATGGDPNGVEGGDTGGRASNDDTPIDYSGGVCPPGQICIGDGVCQSGESEWSSDCAGPDYIVHRWETLNKNIESSEIGKLTTFGNYQGMNGPSQVSQDLGNYGGVQTFDFADLSPLWQVIRTVVLILTSIFCIKVILLKKS